MEEVGDGTKELNSQKTTAARNSKFTTVLGRYGSKSGHEKLGSRQDDAINMSRTPKPIIRRNWWRFFSGWLIHVPALLATTAITANSQRKRFWYSDDGVKFGKFKLTADNLNNILQLPAKLHEILIVASLSAIGLSIFRRRLIGNGVRLGFLTGGYRVGDFEYLISSAFWRQGFSILQPWDIFLAAYLAFATTLSALVGPASAVLLIPIPGWHALDHGLAFKNITLPLVYYSKPESVWPDYFSPDQPAWSNISVYRKIDPEKCKGIQGIYRSGCPAGGFSEIWNWAQSFGSSNLRENLTFQSPNIYRDLIYTQTKNSTTLCTTPSKFFTSSVGLFQKYIDEEPVGIMSNGVRYRLAPKGIHPTQSNLQHPVYQPFVQAKCKVYDKAETFSSGQSLYYPTEFLNCFDDSVCRLFQEQPQSFIQTWMNQTERLNRSVVTTFRTHGTGSPIINIAGQVPDATHNKQNDLVFGCSLLASWVASNYSLDPTVSRTLKSSISDPNIMRGIFEKKKLDDGYIIRFNETWFPFLDPNITVIAQNGLPLSTTAILRLMDLFTSINDVDGTTQTVLAPIEAGNLTAAEILLSKVFGVYVADSLARTSSQEGTNLKLEESEDHLVIVDLLAQHGYFGGVNYFDTFNTTHSTWKRRDVTTLLNKTVSQLSDIMSSGYTKIDFDTERYGFGSGEPRATLTYAVAVMYIYLGTVTVYALAVFFAHALEFLGAKWNNQYIRVWSVLLWDDLQDLVVLALRSQPPYDDDLADSGVDVKSYKVWKKVVKVRADGERNLHLVLHESESLHRVDSIGGGLYF